MDQLPDWAFDVCDAVPEDEEPPLCQCGQHYVGAPCPQKENDEV